VKVLLDMNLSPHWVNVFTSAGIDAVHWFTLGDSGAPDTTIMAYASSHNYIVLTHDLDFGAILAATHGKKPSVVQIRADNISPELIATPVIRALRQMASELEVGALVTIDAKRTRLRVLPL
jgi:predicted nuclease of predicted toxin-antitoxin system